jgi:hypothetical protein
MPQRFVEFLFLLDYAAQTQLQLLRDGTPPDPDAGFFALLRWQTSASVRVGAAGPQLVKLMSRAFSTNLPWPTSSGWSGRRWSASVTLCCISFSTVSAFMISSCPHVGKFESVQLPPNCQTRNRAAKPCLSMATCARARR